jgi:nucleotide-binding universal stress UspA family protein
MEPTLAPLRSADLMWRKRHREAPRGALDAHQSAAARLRQHWCGSSGGSVMYQKLLVPVDGSPTATRGLDEAIRVARLSGGTIRVVHVLDQHFAPGLEFCSAEVLAVLRQSGVEIIGPAKARVEASGVPVEAQVAETLSGTVADTVVDHARQWGADLIVIGTHGRRGVRRLMIGSDAERIVRMATVPVLLVRDDPVATVHSTSEPLLATLPVGMVALE